jgi:hypothetical protein
MIWQTYVFFLSVRMLIRKGGCRCRQMEMRTIEKGRFFNQFWPEYV